MRRRAEARGFPEELRVYDWRDWRPEPAPDDAAPWYSAWYVGLTDWRRARRSWASATGVAESQLPERVKPPGPELMGPVFVAAEEPAPPNRVAARVVRGRRIATHG